MKKLALLALLSVALASPAHADTDKITVDLVVNTCASGKIWYVAAGQTCFTQDIVKRKKSWDVTLRVGLILGGGSLEASGEFSATLDAKLTIPLGNLDSEASVVKWISENPAKVAKAIADAAAKKPELDLKDDETLKKLLTANACSVDDAFAEILRKASENACKK